jgi:hypothetical protein
LDCGIDATFSAAEHRITACGSHSDRHASRFDAMEAVVGPLSGS